ncbi:GNAT family N-acetyltransferase [Streptomyces sp. ACA25]|uniref:GNAT family N-acetyltransferase n=1 Tax=Streptomyces sp. ACA25 TaxID=3022596 RepID=UPI002307D6E0|nr:GNAT family N-acetyltransferase [Streptomyces sp. ACA25]MDB1086723.1 GNAT family N-acetyltransferase [Streptomyces sp. ACA25]
MTTELRELGPDGWDEWYETLVAAFNKIPEPPENRAFDRSVTETDRSFGMWDGKELVGTAGTYSFGLSVPGGAIVPAGGLTMVGVLPTHRRRGILRRMIRHHLEDVRQRGEPLSVLTASEPAIYGRFGYGAATQLLSARIDTGRVRLQVPEGAGGIRLRLADPVEALPRCEEVYARRVTERPGMLERRPGWEQVEVLDPPGERNDGSPLQCVLAERGGEVVGYARYAIRREPNAPGVVARSVLLRGLEADDLDAYASLWRFLFDIDLTSSVTVPDRPVDDAWQHLVSDIRQCRVQLRDSLYLRPVEVGAALSARSYAAGVDVVLEVTDGFCPWNEGRWRLTGGTDGASCVRTDGPADLELSVRELGAAYLGGVSLVSLARAGRVRELRGGALTEAATAFSSPVAPWLPHGF